MTMIWPARTLVLSSLVAGLCALSSTISLAAPAVQLAQIQTPPASSAPSSTVAASYNFTATKSPDGKIVMAGQMPAEPALRYFAAVTKGDTAAVTITGGAPPDFIPNAETGMRALMLLPEGQLSFASKRWSLSGTVATAANRTAALAELGKVGQANFVVSLSLTAAAQVATPPPTAPVATPTPQPASPSAPSPVLTTLPAAAPEPVTNTAPSGTATIAPKPPAAKGTAIITACVEPLRAFSARNSILFKSGAAVIAPESAASLNDLASDLSACPDAVVHVEGHTDADGDAEQNLALSVSRAEAVVGALIERGVTPARLYAVGFGEAKPIADNTTADGKRLNRRIVVTVSPEHY